MTISLYCVYIYIYIYSNIPIIRVSALTEPSNIARKNKYYFFLTTEEHLEFHFTLRKTKSNKTTYFSLHHAYLFTPPLLLKRNYWIAEGQGSKTEACNKREFAEYWSQLIFVHPSLATENGFDLEKC